ncbi:hypothetical protein K493DRAFT_372343 [Basidiobolus meristosporus CBS 931.73]|uniref:Fucosyltransferase n=1 Tax=Basidiobolus meristosporus CBS 931.73 TaxID=1314790 RepID=A0A1Y1Z7E4_9FUNG|nr:hypothetical protein K493DRAFT_372343 [Basidiobolus meristosporus CBS 931.73]|eukprot:ORY06190.1 hypothetical protein K493DRAFT_372343 [Basidiobolus meristosporus CBS 931.73]
MVEDYKILFWTEYFGKGTREGYKISNCGTEYTCTFTHDRAQIGNSSLLYFHIPEYKPEDLPPEQYRDKSIRKIPWVLFSAESTANYPFMANKEKLQIFDYSSTYRRDSHFPISYFGNDLMEVVLRPQAPRGNNTDRASIAWIVSNCNANNNRNYYVKELMKYIDIDIYGHCMENKKWPEGKDTTEIIQDYEFYLAFENSNCQDYVTEKLANAFAAGVVPIVDGPKSYDFVSPTANALININAFENPRELAEYLHSLLADRDKYNELLSYKQGAPLSPAFLKEWDYSNKTGLDALSIVERSNCNVCRVARDIAIFKQSHPLATAKEFWEFATTQLTPAPDYHTGLPADDSCIPSKWSIYRPSHAWLYSFLALLGVVIICILIKFSYYPLKRRYISSYKKLGNLEQDTAIPLE